jgi:cytochrome c peroxidase
MTTRLFAVVILAAVAISIVADHMARATMPAPQPDVLAGPKSIRQAGFPNQMYKWVVPADNPPTPAEVALGEALFFDARLSVDNTVACANCHDPHKGFTDQLPTSMGVHGKFGQRNAPSILNAMFNIEQFWDGREPTLEAQARDPDSEPDRDGDAGPANGGQKVRFDYRIPEGIYQRFRARLQLRRPGESDRSLRTDADCIRLAVRSLHGRR